jgi:cysteine desulfurase
MTANPAKSVYLDYNATALVRPEAAAAIAHALEVGGNPSSVHAAGRAARALVEQARADVAALIAAPASTVIFTSGGTEANALALQSAVAAGTKRLLISAIEHDSVQETAHAAGVAVEEIPVDRSGRADLTWLSERLARWDAADGKPFVALMLANNETGVIQPVAEAAQLVRAADGWLHVDAVQAAGKIAIDSRALGADTLAISAHKIGGPQGVGALVASPDLPLAPLVAGGGQERGRRAGTENVAGIVGFGIAARLAGERLAGAARIAALRDRAEHSLRAAAPRARIFAAAVPRLPNTLCIAMPRVPAATQVMALDLAGVMVSAGAACSSGKLRRSPVLEAMGVAPDEADCAIRISLGWSTTDADIDHLVETWVSVYRRTRANAA